MKEELRNKLLSSETLRDAVGRLAEKLGDDVGQHLEKLIFKELADYDLLLQEANH